MNCEIAIFGAGCFWHVESEFRKLNGVIKTTVGYMGGKLENPSYDDVCTDKTGHVEVVQVVYEPKKISYENLLGLFWRIHDPTSLNRQGPDVGTQYKSVIFYYSKEQRKLAIKSKETLEKSAKFKKGIVTEITPALIFYKAEEYHQQYLEKRGLVTCS
ncbi:MAG: peptide-methionine (S)-S-oxide reductase MsrA [Nanoarchaeota archaeon]